MTEESSELVRQQSWPVDAPAEIEVSVGLGRARIELEDGIGEVRVEVRYDPSTGSGWATQGFNSLINWLGAGPESGLGSIDADLAAEAVRAADISWSDAGGRLVVRNCRELPLRLVPLAVTISAPTGSRLAVRTGSGDVTVTGRAGWAAVRTGSGNVTVAAVDGDADMTTGSGDVGLDAVSGRARVRTGSGRIALTAAGGPTEIKAGSGDVWLGEVTGDLGVRTGSGEVIVADAHTGRLDLTSGTGELRVGVHPGVVAELDLSSGTGRTRSELDVRSVAPEHAPALRVRGRTGTGDVLVTRAAISA